uniref:Putative proteasome assembly chaperone 4-like pogonomyrmex barbatus n=1 Tax=Xenopsylla cheopis TaxID=163159 RepID=A0A6M2DNK7_XENCH
MTGIEEPLNALSLNKEIDDNKAEHVKLVPCSFQFYSFSARFEDATCHYHVIQMNDSIFLYIGNSSHMTNIALSMIPLNSSKASIGTVLVGEATDNVSVGISNKLSKRLSKHVYVSYNYSSEKMIVANVEKRLLEEIAKYPEKF